MAGLTCRCPASRPAWLAAEPGLGHVDDRDAEPRVCVRAQAGAAAGIEISAAVDDQQAKGAHRREHGAQRRRFPREEFAPLVRKYRGDRHRPFGLDGREGGIPAVRAAARAPPQRREQTMAAAKTSRRPSVIPTLTG
jgi:hypothetical protein